MSKFQEYLKEKKFFTEEEVIDLKGNTCLTTDEMIRGNQEQMVAETSKLFGLAKKNGVTEDMVDQAELKLGITVELEHTDDVEIAKKIALDHLAEFGGGKGKDQKYYTELAKMESKLKKETPKKEIEKEDKKDEKKAEKAEEKKDVDKETEKTKKSTEDILASFSS